jgi:putative membrane protein
MIFHPMFGLLGLVVPLFFVGLIVLVVWAVTHSSPHPMSAPPYPPNPPPPVTPRETPLDILQRRFAAGEINADEYQKARDLLRDEPPATGR